MVGIAAASPTVIEFMAVSNKTYSVQYSDSLGITAWLKLADVVARHGGAHSAQRHGHRRVRPLVGAKWRRGKPREIGKIRLGEFVPGETHGHGLAHFG